MPKQSKSPTANAEVLDRLWSAIDDDQDANPAVRASTQLLDRGPAKVAQKFGEEALECLLQAACGKHDGVVTKSADTLYQLLVLWVEAGVRPHEIWLELEKREHEGRQTSGPNGSVSRMLKSVQFNPPKGV